MNLDIDAGVLQVLAICLTVIYGISKMIRQPGLVDPPDE